MKHARVCALLLLSITLFYVRLGHGQSPPVSDPQALSLAAQSILGITGGAVVSDVTISGNATFVAGSDLETGLVILRAKGFGESRVDLNLSGGQRSEIRNNLSGAPLGGWIGTDGTSHAFALHNCWTDPSWFFAPLSSLGAALMNQSVILSYAGHVNNGGRAFEHLHAYIYVSGQPTLATLSAMDFYLDSASLLPIVIQFNVHPDDDFGANISVEIDFSNYQPVNGVQVPLHIQKFVDGTVTLDLAITSAVVNSGLPDSTFSIP